MSSITLTTLCRWVAWLLVVAIAAFTLSPIELRPTTAAPADWERFAAFAVMGGVFCLGYPKHRLAVVLLLLAIVGLLEVGQNIVSGRHGRLPDGLVKAAGALLGALVALSIDKGMARRKVLS